MAFTGNEAEEFPLETAAQWTKNYRDSISQGDTRAHFFGKNILEDILAQQGCVGIRVYYALDGNGNKQLIMVGANADEEDLYNGIIAEVSVACPPNCSGNSPLNS